MLVEAGPSSSPLISCACGPSLGHLSEALYTFIMFLASGAVHPPIPAISHTRQMLLCACAVVRACPSGLFGRPGLIVRQSYLWCHCCHFHLRRGDGDGLS